MIKFKCCDAVNLNFKTYLSQKVFSFLETTKQDSVVTRVQKIIFFLVSQYAKHNYKGVLQKEHLNCLKFFCSAKPNKISIIKIMSDISSLQQKMKIGVSFSIRYINDERSYKFTVANAK